jgi:predicted dehydrogenase/threonine dehydrogenase-like Zn-dependent dehydrogenase
MQAIVENLRTGEVLTIQAPKPELRPGGILVSTHYSAISSGTERAKVEMGQKSLLQKAIARPELAKQVFEYACQNGIRAAYQKVQARLDALSTLGYSAAGVVLEVAEDVPEFKPGDRVACAGTGYANHCQVNFIPRNLAVKIPDGVPLSAASLTTIGAIAMQGLRQAQLSFGETVAVIGVGLVGVLAIQLVRASGCRAIAIDRNPVRAEKAVELGAHLGLAADDPSLQVAIQDFSRYGVDVAIVTAATPSAEPVELAARILRDRGRVVIVGDVGMGVSRAPMYAKELALVMSRSYGPGRYDPEYEEGGRDYPIGYVRWTERRNMEAFLDLLALGALNLDFLLQRRYPVGAGAEAYRDIRTNGAYTAIIEYGEPPEERPSPRPASAARQDNRPQKDVLRIGAIGAGNFARSNTFPTIRANRNAILCSVASASGVAAESARKVFGFARAETPAELLRDPEIDAAFILSRHDSHARYVLEALAHHKHVFVEKPLATTREQLQAIENAYRGLEKAGNQPPCLMVGFNRRFASATEEIRRFFGSRSEPMLVHIRVNAGYQPKDHWVHADGGRIVGEVCHFADWARSIIARPIRSVSAFDLPDGARYSRDNVAVTLSFEDGSIASLLYLANGDTAVPKEYFELFCAGSVARLDDFRTLSLTRNRKTRVIRTHQDKGHKRELALTIEAMRSGGPSPIPFEELMEVTEATLAVCESACSCQPIAVPLNRCARHKVSI